MSWHMGQNGRSGKPKNCAAASSDFHSSTTSLCQSGAIAPSKLHLPPWTERNRGNKPPQKTEKLTAFSTAGWLFRNNLAGVCWLCLRSADSCRAWLSFSLWDKCFPSTSTVFAVLNSSLSIFISVTFFFHLRDRAFFFFFVSSSSRSSVCKIIHSYPLQNGTAM